MTTLEELGLLKMDFLGLRNLTVLDDAVKMVQRYKPDFTLADILDDDPETYEMISQVGCRRSPYRYRAWIPAPG